MSLLSAIVPGVKQLLDLLWENKILKAELKRLRASKRKLEKELEKSKSK